MPAHVIDAITLSPSPIVTIVGFPIRGAPGIGILIAMEILVELPEMELFKSGEELASYLGLTPSEYSTGQYVREGRITRCGNKRVRTCAVEGSWILITKDPLMRFKYLQSPRTNRS